MIACLGKSGCSPLLLNALNDLFPISLKMLPIFPSLESCMYPCVLRYTQVSFLYSFGGKQSAQVARPLGAGRRYTPGNLS